MTTIFQQTVTCGHCGTENEVIELGSTNSFGSMDLDMRPPPMRKLPRQADTSKIELPAWVVRYSAGLSPPSESCGRISL